MNGTPPSARQWRQVSVLDFGGGLLEHGDSYPNADKGEATMQGDEKEKQEPQAVEAERTEDLEVGDEAKNVTGGLRSNPDARGQLA